MATLLLVIFGSFAWIVFSTAVLKMHPFLALLLAAIGVAFLLGFTVETTLLTIGKGFGQMLSTIGPIIVLGGVLGALLEKSGAVSVLSTIMIRSFGEKKPATLLGYLGILVGIPVFCDAGFIILQRLAQQISRNTGKSAASLSIALSAGLYSAHTIIPPTPGPVAAVGNLQASNHLGLVMLFGFLAAVVSMPVVIFFANRLSSSVLIVNAPSNTEAPIETKLSIFKALFPVFTPIMLIAMGTISGYLSLDMPLLTFCGSPMIALLITVLTSAWLLGFGMGEQLAGITKSALEQVGAILVITGAGGAFGAVLAQSELSAQVASLLTADQSGFVYMVSGFALAAILKTAQGSSTAALVVASAIIASVLPAALLESRVFVALLVVALGGGAMTISHTNDSYFWVVSQLSGLNTRDALRSYSFVTAIHGFTLLLIAMTFYWLWMILA